MTEKEIRAAFQKAEKDNAILFFDEIDSLLFSRQGAQRSWEVSQVNELLTNIENFWGIFIAATNHKEILDSAAIRRFNHKIRFDYLRVEGVMSFYELYLSPLVHTEMDSTHRRRLAELSYLTPGDFKVVYESHVFSDKNQLDHTRLIDALQQEMTAKNETINRIGF